MGETEMNQAERTEALYHRRALQQATDAMKTTLQAAVLQLTTTCSHFEAMTTDEIVNDLVHIETARLRMNRRTARGIRTPPEAHPLRPTHQTREKTMTRQLQEDLTRITNQLRALAQELRGIYYDPHTTGPTQSQILAAYNNTIRASVWTKAAAMEPIPETTPPLDYPKR